jgi:hypothetical protein
LDLIPTNVSRSNYQVIQNLVGMLYHVHHSRVVVPVLLLTLALGMGTAPTPSLELIN